LAHTATASASSPLTQKAFQHLCVAMALASAAAACLVLLASALVGAAPAGGPPAGGSQCGGLLRTIAAEHHSDMELVAYCRAMAPPQFCRDAFRTLGAQPWAPETIDGACTKWQEGSRAGAAVAAPGRKAMDYAQLQAYCDHAVKAKAQAGLCKDKATGAPMPFDKCAEYKAATYPNQTKAIIDALSGFYNATMAGAPQQKSEDVGPVAAGGGLSPGFAAVWALLAASLAVAGVAVTSRHLRRSSSRDAEEENDPLVDSAEDDA